MSKDNLLEIRNLSCERNDILVFKNFSLKLDSGNIRLIDGKNGSGKTSLLLCIAGIIDYQGEILFNKKYENKLGYVGHQNALIETETVKDFFIHWKKVYRYENDFLELTYNFKLNNKLDLPIKFLSFGQKKALSFARLQMINSKIWLLDEPVSGLDQQTELLILDLIEKHCALGGGVIATSHQPVNFKNKKKLKRIKIA